MDEKYITYTQKYWCKIMFRLKILVKKMRWKINARKHRMDTLQREDTLFSNVEEKKFNMINYYNLM